MIGRGTGAEIRLTENGSLVESEVPIGADEAWRALPEAYASLGLGGGVLDAVGRTWGNPRVEERRVAGSRTSSFFRCATSGAGPSSVGRLRIRLAISTTVAAAEGGDAVLSTSVVATGAPWEGTSTDPVGCTSLGRLEEALADAVLGAGGPEVGR